MNAARQRRVALKKRIEEQRKKRDDRQLKRWLKSFRQPTPAEEARQEKQMRELLNDPEIMEWNLKEKLKINEVKDATVFIDQQSPFLPFLTLPIKLPLRNPTEKIMAMRKNGFWTVHHGHVLWFPGELIKGVMFDCE